VGAEGGLGGGLLALTKAELKFGTKAVLDTKQFEKIIEGYDLVITGEGRIDAQSAYGKVPKGVGTRAQKHGKPVIAIVGSVGDGAEVMYGFGLEAIFPIVNKIMSLDEAVEDAYNLVIQAAETVFRLIRTGKALKI